MLPIREIELFSTPSIARKYLESGARKYGVDVSVVSLSSERKRGAGGFGGMLCRPTNVGTQVTYNG